MQRLPLVTGGQLVAELKSLKNLKTPYAFAKYWGCSQTTARAWESDYTIPDDANGERLALALGYPVGHVLLCLAIQRTAKSGHANLAEDMGTYLLGAQAA